MNAKSLRLARAIRPAVAGLAALLAAAASGGEITVAPMETPLHAGNSCSFLLKGLTNVVNPVLFIAPRDANLLAPDPNGYVNLPNGVDEKLLNCGALRPSGGAPTYLDIHVFINSSVTTFSPRITVLDPPGFGFDLATNLAVGFQTAAAVHRSFIALGSLPVEITSSQPDILGLSPTAAGQPTNGTISITLNPRELSRTFYASARALPPGTAASNITLTARCGSFVSTAHIAVFDVLQNADSDGDGLCDADELNVYRTDPYRPDTDEDGVPDGREVQDITDPAHPMSGTNYAERSLNLAQAPGGYLPMPTRFGVGTRGWSVEFWIHPGSDGTGDVFRFGYDGPSAQPRFRVGLEDYRPVGEILVSTNAAQTVRVAVGGTNIMPEVGQIQQLPTGVWSHVGCVWAPDRNSFEMYLNGVLLIAQETLVAPDFAAGQAVLGQGFTDGFLDELRAWDYDRSRAEIADWCNRLFPAPAGYVSLPPVGSRLSLYYRFDNGGTNINDFAHLNDPAYFLPVAGGAMIRQPAIALPGSDDEDGDRLPEWWVRLHNLEQYPRVGYYDPVMGLFFDCYHKTVQDGGPVYTNDFDKNNGFLARELFATSFFSHGSVGGTTSASWYDPDDKKFYAPRDRGLGAMGRFASFAKYVYLDKSPQAAQFNIFTPGMTNTRAWVNGNAITPEGGTTSTAQRLNVASYLRVGRNLLVVRCESSYAKYLDSARTLPAAPDYDCNHFEGILGKFDASLACDGVEVVLRGDHARNDPRSVWLVLGESRAAAQGAALIPFADGEDRALPANLDYGLPLDPDVDNLNDYYEYRVLTNPRDADSNNNGVPDGMEDYDGDGLVNGDEQARGSDPTLPDTDDDGLVDGLDASGNNDPASALLPIASRSLLCAGSTNDYLEFPLNARFALNDWTLEALVRADNTSGGILLRRTASPIGVNYQLGLLTNNLPYVRFVSVDGVAVTAQAAQALATGAWAHVAGSYDSSRRYLRLYVNGVCVSTNLAALKAPAVYAGGPVIQRIGEGLAGALDEVRIWSLPRTEAELAANLNRSVPGTESGLAAYYRFDDSTSFTSAPPVTVGTSANNGTNGALRVQPWTWGQVQDYVPPYDTDWQLNWLHGATLHGRVGFSTNGGGAIGSPPMLQVSILPADVVAAGAQWSLLGGSAWYNSAQLVSEGLVTGRQTVLFKTIAGWTTPPNFPIQLSNNVKTLVEAVYLRNGRLQVTLTPNDAVLAGAKWRVDGGAWLDSAATVQNLSPAAHFVEFNSVPGWTPPAALNLNVPEGDLRTYLGNYSPVSGSAQGILAPPAAIAAGARWRIDAGTPRTSGEVVAGLTIGSHTITFDPLTDWIAPTSLTVSVSESATLVFTGVFSQVTGLRIYLAPMGAVAAGAQWRISGGDWNASGATLPLSPGTYAVEFNAPENWAPPAGLQAAVTNGLITSRTGQYYAMLAYGAGYTNLPYFTLNQPRGLALDAQRRLYIADSMNHRIVVFDTLNNTASVLGGPGALPGEFAQPMGVAVDAVGNLFVADANNHRVQRRDALTGIWSVWGGPSAGTLPGQFNVPFDIAVDAATNVFVADTYNLRVQRLDGGSGLWSEWIHNGFANGSVRYAQGLGVDRSNRVNVADWYSTSSGIYSRVQTFRPDASWAGLAGTSATNAGGLAKPRQMAAGGAGEWYVADMDNHRVALLSPTGSWSTLVGAILSSPEGVAWDPRGYVYVADTQNNRLLRIETGWTTNMPPQLALSLLAPQTRLLGWQGSAGWFYTVRYTDCAPGMGCSNLPAGIRIPGSNGWMQVMDAAPLPGRRFYGLQAE